MKSFWVIIFLAILFIPVSVSAYVGINFTSNVTFGIVPLSVQFNETVNHTLYSSNLTYLWGFEDPDGPELYDGKYYANSTDQNPVHTWNDVGSYSVKLNIYNADSGGGLIGDIFYDNYITAVNSSDIYSTSGTSYWTCPDGVYNITIRLSGAGGSGRGSWVCSAPDTCAGDGGKAGGHITISRIAVVPGTVYPIVVGAKGANATHDTASNAGGATTAFGVSMPGGAGGGYLYTVANGGNGEDGDGTTTYAFDGGDANPLIGGTAGTGYGGGGGGGAGYTGGGLDTQGGAGADGYVEIWTYGLVSNNIPQFSADITNGKAGTLVHFTDSSTIINATGLVYNWSFGDGTYSSVMGSVQHVYSYTGSYDVKLTLTSAAGEISELKPAYISITSQDITIYPTPRTVTLTCVDEDFKPVKDVYVTATPLNFTAPATWITTYYGFSGVDFSGTTLMGYTGLDGSWSGPIMSSYLYRFNFTKAGMPDYNMTFYPSSTSYIIRLPTTTEETPINELVSYTLYNATINSTAEFFNLTYQDTSGGTSTISLVVKNDTGAIMYNNTTASPGTALVAMSSGAISHSAGETYEYQLSAVQSKVGYVNQSYFVTWERLRTLSMFPAWVSQWFGIVLIILFAGIGSAISVKYTVVMLPFWTGFLTIYMKMVDPAISVGSLLASLGIIAVIGAIKYTRESEKKL